MYHKAIRSTVKKLGSQKILATMLSGGAALALAWLLNVLLWHLLCQPYVDSNPNINLPMDERNFYYILWLTPYTWGVYAFNCFSFFVIGAFWSMVALAIAVWIPERFLLLSMPTALYFFWLSLPEQSFFLGFGFLPSPVDIINDGVSWAGYRETLLFYIVLTVICIVLYYLGLRRRVSNV